jgi:hypothetical protein
MTYRVVFRSVMLMALSFRKRIPPLPAPASSPVLTIHRSIATPLASHILLNSVASTQVAGDGTFCGLETSAIHLGSFFRLERSME